MEQGWRSARTVRPADDARQHPTRGVWRRAQMRWPTKSSGIETLQKPSWESDQQVIDEHTVRRKNSLALAATMKSWQNISGTWSSRSSSSPVWSWVCRSSKAGAGPVSLGRKWVTGTSLAVANRSVWETGGVVSAQDALFDRQTSDFLLFRVLTHLTCWQPVKPFQMRVLKQGVEFRGLKLAPSAWSARAGSRLGGPPQVSPALAGPCRPPFGGGSSGAGSLSAF